MTSRSQSRHRPWRRALGALAVAAAASAGALVAHEPAFGQDDPKVISFTAERMSVKAFLQVLSEKGGLTILDEAGVEGDITAIAQKKLTRDEALDLLRAWLQPKQRTAIRTGNVVRIMTLEDAKKRGSLPVKLGYDPDKVPENDEIVTQVIPLRRVRADDVRREFRGLLTADGQLYVEPTSNSLVITDTQAAIRRVLLVLGPIDRSPALELRVRVFRLLNANADEVATIVRELFPSAQQRAQRGGGRGGQGGQQGGFGNVMRQFFGGGGGPGGGGRGGGGGPGGGNQASPEADTDVNISVDRRSNSIIVSATEEQFKLIEPLVKEIDTTPIAVATDLRSFRLANASPVDMAAILTELFQPTSQTTQQGGNRGGQGNQNQNIPGFMRQFLAAGGESEPASRYTPDPKFTVDARTNSLIVSAIPSHMKVIEALIKDLDTDNTFRQSILVVPIRNSSAQNIAKVVNDLLSAANTTTRQTGGNRPGQAATQTQTALAELSGDVKVVADTDSNALVVTTSPKNFGRIRQIILDLDRPKRQVLIEVLIAEISLDSKGELGIQFTTNWIRGIDGREGGTSTAMSDLGLGALTQGFRYMSSSDKLTGVIRALQTDGKLNVLSSPKILTLENQQAELSVGREVPFITNSRITQNGDTVNTVQYRNIGIILRVTPQINEVGDVRMVVHPEVSDIGPESQGVIISNGVRSPVFQRNFADTTIIVRDGETAILGGLIRNELTETVQKLPIVGDIPLVGLLFRSKTTQTRKVELVVFMTPHVVESAEQLRNRTQQTKNKLVLVPPEILKDELDRWTRGLEENSAVARYNKGTVYMEAGRYKQAVEELEEARELAPRDAATRFNLGLAYAKCGDLEKAEAELRAAAALDPRDAETRYNLGAVLWRRSDFVGAAREFKFAFELDPGHDDARRWAARAEAAARDVPHGDSGNGKEGGP